MLREPYGAARRPAVPLLCLMFAFLFICPVYADTNGSEIQISNQPDRLILQLGSEWAGVEFELKTDAGIFPMPVIVDPSGLLKMDLGGSKVYTLSCLASSVPPPSPAKSLDVQPTLPEQIPAENEITPEPVQTKSGTPTLYLAMFICGAAVAVCGLFTLRYLKSRREAAYDDDDYDEDAPEQF
jgi:hypothetical protein